MYILLSMCLYLYIGEMVKTKVVIKAVKEYPIKDSKEMKLTFDVLIYDEEGTLIVECNGCQLYRGFINGSSVRTRRGGFVPVVELGVITYQQAAIEIEKQPLYRELTGRGCLETLRPIEEHPRFKALFTPLKIA
jgi:hypothetical protein